MRRLGYNRPVPVRDAIAPIVDGEPRSDRGTRRPAAGQTNGSLHSGAFCHWVHLGTATLAAI